MKYYIQLLLSKCISNEGKNLYNCFKCHRPSFEYDKREDAFFYKLDPEDVYYDYFQQFRSRAPRNVEGTHIHYRVTEDSVLLIWME